MDLKWSVRSNDDDAVLLQISRFGLSRDAQCHHCDDAAHTAGGILRADETVDAWMKSIPSIMIGVALRYALTRRSGNACVSFSPTPAQNSYLNPSRAWRAVATDSDWPKLASPVCELLFRRFRTVAVLNRLKMSIDSRKRRFPADLRSLSTRI